MPGPTRMDVSNLSFSLSNHLVKESIGWCSTLNPISPRLVSSASIRRSRWSSRSTTRPNTIMCLGTTYYFTWLDARLSEEEKAAANTGSAAQLWMVHSGGFYVVERRKVPDLISRTLHWFRWEAGTTWLSGFALLILVYYIGGGALIDPDVR